MYSLLYIIYIYIITLYIYIHIYIYIIYTYIIYYIYRYITIYIYIYIYMVYVVVPNTGRLESHRIQVSQICGLPCTLGTASRVCECQIHFQNK
jgi:hypothetical protein